MGRGTIALDGRWRFHVGDDVSGRGLPLESGLPLGLSEGTAYAESFFQLGEGEQVTLLTDGVVEAREKTGALFGFERSAALSGESAEAIAAAAQQFGQDDDITVVTLTRNCVPAVVSAQSSVPVHLS
jgi:hypothetical protein